MRSGRPSGVGIEKLRGAKHLSMVAYLALALSPASAAPEPAKNVDNNSEPDKQLEFSGDLNQGGHIKTSGMGNTTTIQWAGYLTKGNLEASNGGKNDITFSSGGIASSSVDADVGSNTITFNGASFFGITTLSAKSGGSNTITDNRNGAKATASTLNSLTAEASGANTLINLKNTTTTTVSAKAGQNAITLDKSSKIGTKLEAADGGANTIVLNSDAKFQDTDIKASGSSTKASKNNISGDSNNAGTIKSITAENSGTNNINLKRVSITDINAKSAGKNTINLSTGGDIGNIIADGAGASNAITLDKSSKIGSTLSAMDGGANTIVLNSDAKFQNTDIKASGAGSTGTSSVSKNNISGDSNNAGTIKSITAENSGTNNINLTKVSITGDINAKSAGKNTINLSTGGDIGNIIADGAGASNTITLDGTSKITGYVLAKTGGINTITLNGASSFSQTATSQTTNGGMAANATASILATGSGSSNTITGNTANAGNLKSGISAIDSGQNTITLSKLDINGDIIANSKGTNTITLNAHGSSKNITAKDADSKNTVSMMDGTVSGNITADAGANEVTISGNGDRIKGNLEASSNGTNKLTLSEGAQITGHISAKSGGTNTIVLNNDSGFKDTPDTASITSSPQGANTHAGILAQGAGSKNDIKATTTGSNSGTIKGDIRATDAGNNVIDVQQVSVDGEILADNKGVNEIALAFGGYVNKITATGDGSKNKYSMGGTAEVRDAILADNKGMNEINTSGQSRIDGTITAKGGGKNIITMQESTMATKEVLAESSGTNTFTMNGQAKLTGSTTATGKDSSNSFMLTDAAEVSGSVLAKENASNSFDMQDSSVVSGSITATGNGTAAGSESKNTLTMKGSSSVSGFISAMGNYGQNTLTLADTAFLDLHKGQNDTALYADGSETATNTITDSGSGANKIEGNIVASNKGKNTLTLNSLTQNGSILAETSGLNTIKIGSKDKTTQSSITGNITATGGNGGSATTPDTKNIMEFYDTSIIGDMMASKAGGHNELKLYGGNSSGIFSATDSGTNAIYMGDSTHRASLTGHIQSDKSGKNTITLSNTNITDGIIANDGGENDISIDAPEDNQSHSDITANSNGKNKVTFKSGMGGGVTNVGLVGNILANAGGQNTITDKGSNTKSILTGRIEANGKGAKNTMTFDNMEVSDQILAQDEGVNNVDEINTRLFSKEINALTTGSNTIKITGGELETIRMSAEGTTAKNAVTLENKTGSSHINFHYDDALDGGDGGGEVGGLNDLEAIDAQKTVILAKDAKAINTITDNTSGTENKIKGNIRALDGGENNLMLKKVTEEGKIIAQNDGKNIINFGSANGAKSSMSGAHTISKIGENKMTLHNLDFEGSLQSLLTGSSNEITLDSNSTFEGYLVAITDRAKDVGLEDKITATPKNDEAKNTLKLDVNAANVTVKLRGAQVRDAAYKNRGTGKDAIYTEGEKAKNDIEVSKDATWDIDGNITAFNEGTNTYDFLKKLTMKGSLHAENNKADKDKNTTNTITLHNDSTIGEGYILARGKNTANTLTLNDTSKLEKSYVEADATGGNSAKNTIEAKNTSTISLSAAQNGNAVSANAQGAENDIKGDTTGKNSITGNISASTAGVNKINLQHLNISGNISANNAGSNTIDVTSIKNGTVQDADINQIKGDSISASTASARNTLNLADSNLNYKQVLADGTGVNTITMTKKSNFEIKNANQTAISADSRGASNTIKGIAGEVDGHINASDAGKNDIHNSDTLRVNEGYIRAIGADSTNTLLSDTTLTMNITGKDNDTHAVLADTLGAKNTITTTKFSDGENNISGNITARNLGQNDIKIGKTTMQGNLIAQLSGKNIVNIGSPTGKDGTAQNQTPPAQPNNPAQPTPPIDQPLDPNAQYVPTLPDTQAPSDGGSFSGGVYALGENSENELYFNAESLVTFSTDPAYGGEQKAEKASTSNLTSLPQSFSYAILVDSDHAKNTIIGRSKDDSKITSDIGALNSGVNDIYLSNLSFNGTSINASDRGHNTIMIGNAKNLDFGVMSAVGADSVNTLVSYDFVNKTTGNQRKDGVGTLSGLMYADNSGVNDLRVRLTDRSQTARVDVTTLSLASNTLAVQNVDKAKSVIRYIDGSTQILLAGSNTADNEAKKQIKTKDTYYDGILLTPSAEDANEMLKDFRYFSGLEENRASVEMSNKSTFSFGGVYIGKIEFLDSENTNSGSGTSTINQNPDITIEKNAALAARITYSNTGNMNVHMQNGARWIVLPSSISVYNVKLLEGREGITYDKQTASSSTFANPNTIIDIATGGVNTRYNITKDPSFDNPDSYTKFNVENTKNLDNVIFRLYTDTVDKKADLIHIKGADKAAPTHDARLQVFYSKDSLRNATKYNEGTDKIKVATVANGAKENFGFNIAEETEVKQGYVLVNTEFEKRVEKENGKMVDNYYIKTYLSQMDPEEAKKSFSVLGINYLVYLSATNNINKRLGERREKDHPDSFWIRSYGGSVMQNYGTEVKNTYVGTQGGYDYGIRTQKAMHYIGVAGGYGMNWINTTEGKMDSQLFSGALYYSYVRDSGIYVDSIAKYDYIDTNPYGVNNFRGHIQSSAVSLSEELGYRIYMAKKRMYMDMGLEGIFGYLQGFETLQDNGSSQLAGRVDDFYALRGRAYLNLAYSLKIGKTQTDFRVGGAYVGDYATMKLNLKSLDDGSKENFKTPYNQMIMASAGINAKITDVFRIYLEGEMGFMGQSINQIWAANFGMQFAFGTTKDTDFASFDDDDELSIHTKTIDAPKIRCIGCNPESGIYLELVVLPRPNQALDNYLKQYNYRVHNDSAAKQATYYIGPFKSIDEARAQMPTFSKIAQSLTKNPNAEAGIVKIHNKSRS